MGRSLIGLAVLAAGAVAALAEDVITLTGDTFTQAVKDNEKLVVEFYAPWCGHCKKLAPEYETAAGKLKDDGIVLAKVDATEDGNKDLAKKYDIQGFPTIKLFRGSEDGPSEYEGPRESAGIVTALKKQFGPAYVELTTKDAVAQAQKAEEEVSVLGVFPSAGDGLTAFKEAAEALRNDGQFAYVSDASLVDDADGKEAVILYRDFDEPKVKYDGKMTKDALAEWVGKQSEPRLPELDRSPRNKKAMQRIFGDDKPKVLGVAKADFDKLKEFKETLIAIQEAHAGVHVVFVDPASNKGALNFFGASEDKLPTLLIHDGANDAKYNPGVIEISGMKKYVDDFTAGKLEKTVKSEDPPVSNDGPVTIATAKTLKDIVDSGKNVLIEFYAPWCGHCKKLEPTFNELGESYQAEDKVVIAKMDATANDVTDSRFDVKGFPTLYFVSEKGDVQKYESGRDLESLQKFLEKETGIKPVEKDTDPADATKDEAGEKKDEL